MGLIEEAREESVWMLRACDVTQPDSWPMVPTAKVTALAIRVRELADALVVMQGKLREALREVSRLQIAKDEQSLARHVAEAALASLSLPDEETQEAEV